MNIYEELEKLFNDFPEQFTNEQSAIFIRGHVEYLIEKHFDRLKKEFIEFAIKVADNLSKKCEKELNK